MPDPSPPGRHTFVVPDAMTGRRVIMSLGVNDVQGGAWPPRWRWWKRRRAIRLAAAEYQRNVAELVQKARDHAGPGGTVAVWTTNYVPHAISLPGTPREEGRN